MPIVNLLFKNKRRVGLIVGLITLMFVFYLLSSGGYLPSTPPVIVNNSTPPVVLNTAELVLVNTNPQVGHRETVNPFSQTFFEFSADLDEKSAVVTTSPYIVINTKVYKTDPRTLVVEPSKSPWIDDIEYTITIKKIKGINGDELKNPVEYKFSNTVLTEVVGGDLN
ncbi:hypothetical protein COT50_02025 [candidate division WWE3 bacterium CG08_land_8_20_14_0_20_41_10]|uniref:SbsA Ig-like domain-containing protein n=1 Tax=candidate division WWE3 bacterium CG08_land_8_20_14_0_20_41_10 TaxID=1975085 RepID=A0A2H0XE77_UNCKA|nr:MAG: hypothetical protein COT50_02025 [candidate division WWE3 bacterium CG08_land_8_20_14_0_20_41_10]